MKQRPAISFALVFILLVVPVSSQGGQESQIDYGSDVSDGFVKGPYGWDLWYVWLNTSGTNVLFLAMYSGIYPSPINYFVGQHYFTANDTEMFVGNRLLGFEIYKDLNGNSVLDANYTDGYDPASDEARYYFLLNASLTADLIPSSKSQIDNVTHYTWGVKYTQVQGNMAEIVNETSSYVGDPETGERFPSRLRGYVNAVLDFLNLKFDYWIQDNVAYLKIGLELGTFTVQPWFPEQYFPIALGETSLSALYCTSVITVKPYSIKPQNATQEAEAVKTSAMTVNVEQKEAFRLIFGENYTLNDEPTQYRSAAGIYSIDSLPGDIIVSAAYFTKDAEEIFKEQLGETSPNLSQNVTFGVQKSSVLYRECYPVWGNQTLSHDPLFIAYIGEAGPTRPSEGGGDAVSRMTPLPLTWLIAAVVLGMVVLAVAVRRQTRIRDYKRTSP